MPHDVTLHFIDLNDLLIEMLVDKLADRLVGVTADRLVGYWCALYLFSLLI